jgi:hypothetical protein
MIHHVLDMFSTFRFYCYSNMYLFIFHIVCTLRVLFFLSHVPLHVLHDWYTLDSLFQKQVPLEFLEVCVFCTMRVFLLLSHTITCFICHKNSVFCPNLYTYMFYMAWATRVLYLLGQVTLHVFWVALTAMSIKDVF